VSVASTIGAPPVGPVITGTPGTYSLSGFGGGAYTIKPTKPAGPNAAISSLDAARVSQGVSGAVAFVSQNQRFAADASGNGTVSSQDAAFIGRFAAGLDNFGSTAQWKFFVGGAPSPLPTPPATYNDSRSYVSVSSNLSGEDYVALLIGEVSGNWNPATNPRPAIGNGPAISVELPQMAAAGGKDLVIPVSVRGIADKGIIAYEFDLRYDPNVIQPQADPVALAGTASRGLVAIANPKEPGLLRVVLYGPMPITDDGLLLDLRFSAVGTPGSVSPLSFEQLLFNDGETAAVVTEGRVEISSAAAQAAKLRN
jgi:hypothetical protein